MIIAKDLLTDDTIYDFVIIATSRTKKVTTKTVQVYVLPSGSDAPLESFISVSASGFIKPSIDFKVTCSSPNYVDYSLIVDVDGYDKSSYFAPIITTSTHGVFYFASNSFNKN